MSLSVALGSQSPSTNASVSIHSQLPTPQSAPHDIYTPSLSLLHSSNTVVVDDSRTPVLSVKSFSPLPLAPPQRPGSKRILMPKRSRSLLSKPSPKSLLASFTRNSGIGSVGSHRSTFSEMPDTVNKDNGKALPKSQEWDVVEPPPPPKYVANPHQYASARRQVNSSNHSYIPSRNSTPLPVAILPTKTEDGGSTPKRSCSQQIPPSEVASRRSESSGRSGGSVLGPRNSGLRSTCLDSQRESDEEPPILVKKRKSRLALDLVWALGDRTNSQTKEKDASSRSSIPTSLLEGKDSNGSDTLLSRKSSTSTLFTLKPKTSSGRLTPDSAEGVRKIGHNGTIRERWKRSISGMTLGRGRRDGTAGKENVKIVDRSSSLKPLAIQNLPAFTSSLSATVAPELQYRSPSLDYHPPVPLPQQLSSQCSVSVSSPQTTTLSSDEERPPLGYMPLNAIVPSPVLHCSLQGNDDPTLIIPSLDASRRIHTSNNRSAEMGSGSLAIRAMRSVRSLARIGSRSALKSPSDMEGPSMTRRSKLWLNSFHGKTMAISSPPARIDVTSKRRSSDSHESWVIGSLHSFEDDPLDYHHSISTNPRLQFAEPLFSASAREEPVDVLGGGRCRSEVLSSDPGGSHGDIAKQRNDRAAEHLKSSSTQNNDSMISLHTALGTTARTASCMGADGSLHTSTRAGFISSAIENSGYPVQTLRSALGPATKSTPRNRGSLISLFNPVEVTPSHARSCSGRLSAQGITELPQVGTTEISPYWNNTVTGSRTSSFDQFSGARPSLEVSAKSFMSEGNGRALHSPHSMFCKTLGDTEQCSSTVSRNSEDYAISIVSAATTELSDLIHHLDLSATPDCSPLKNFDPLKSQMKETGCPEVSTPRLANGIDFKHSDRSFSSDVINPETADIEGHEEVGVSTFGRRAIFTQQLIHGDIRMKEAHRDRATVARDPQMSTTPTENLSGRLGSTLNGVSSLRGFWETKITTGTIQSYSGKISTGTALSLFGSQNLRTKTGEASLSAFEIGNSHAHDEEEDSDIPDELQRILSTRTGTASTWKRTLDYGSRYVSSPPSIPLEIPGPELDFASICNYERPPSSLSLPLTPAPSDPLPPRPSRHSGLDTSFSDSLCAGETPGASNALTPTSNSITSQCPLYVDGGITGDNAMADSLSSDFGEDCESSLSDNGDHLDDTGKTSFDFTRELSRLNEGGSRMSFVKELENAFQTVGRVSSPVRLTTIEQLPAPDDDESKISKMSTQCTSTQLGATANTIADPQIAHSVSCMDARSSLLVTEHPDLPREKPFFNWSTDFSFRGAPSTERDKIRPEHVRAASLGQNLDALVATLAELDSPSMHHTIPRPRSACFGIDHSSKPHTQIDPDRGFSQGLQSNDIVASRSSSGGFGFKNSYSPFDSYQIDEDDCVTLPSLITNMTHDTELETSDRNRCAGSVKMDSDPRDHSIYASASSQLDRQQSGQVGSKLDVDSDINVSRFSIDSGFSNIFIDSQCGISPLSPFNLTSSSCLTALTKSSSAPAGTCEVLGVYREEQSPTGHQTNYSRHSTASGCSVARLGRPGLGDKMFEAQDLPDERLLNEFMQEGTMKDASSSRSISTRQLQRRSIESMPDRTRSRPSSVSSESVFGIHDKVRPANQRVLFPPVTGRLCRPFSVLRNESCTGDTTQEDETLISMIGGDDTRFSRNALDSSANSSPCVRVQKGRRRVQTNQEACEGSKVQSDGTNMIQDSLPSMDCSKSRTEVSVNNDLQSSVQTNNHLTSQGRIISEDAANIFEVIPAIAIQRLSPKIRTSHYQPPTPLIFNAAPPDTPPLSRCSSAGGSQSSIDLEQLRLLLEDIASNTSVATNESRARARGQGHRRPRPISQVSRCSTIEPIAEEPTCSDQVGNVGGDIVTIGSSMYQDVDIYDPQDDQKVGKIWREEGQVTSTQYHAFKNEAISVVEKSKLVWLDTEFSKFSVSSFHPPNNPSSIRALIEHSQKAFTPLPLELRVRKPRSRANSRPTPYPSLGAPRTRKRSMPRKLHTHARTRSMEAAMACIAPFPMVNQAEVRHEAHINSLPTSASVMKSQPSLSANPSVVALGEQSLKRLGEFTVQTPLPPPTESTKRRPLEVDTNIRTDRKKTAMKRVELVGSSIQNSSACGKENKESEASGIMNNLYPNGSLRLSRARPPQRRLNKLMASAANSANNYV